MSASTAGSALASTLGGRLLSRAGFAFGGRIGGAALTYLAFVASSRWIGREEFGRYQFAYSAAMVLATVCCLGLPQAAQRFLAESISHGRMGLANGFLRWGRKVLLLAGLGLGALAALATPVLPFESAGGAFTVAMLALPLWCLIRFQTSTAQAFSKLPLMVLPNNVVRPAFLLLGIGVLWKLDVEAGSTGLMTWHVLVLAAVVLWQGCALRSSLGAELRLAPPETRRREWFHTSAPLLLVSLVTSFSPELSAVTVGLVVDAEDLALFTASFRTAFLVSFAMMAIDSITLPKAAQLFATGQLRAMEELVRHATMLRTLSALAGMAALAAAGPFVLALFGSGFDSAYPSLLVLGSAMLVRAALGPALELLSVSGHHQRSFRLCLVHVVVTLLALPLLTISYGVLGGAVGVLLSTALLGVLALRTVVREIGIEPCPLRPRATQGTATPPDENSP